MGTSRSRAHAAKKRKNRVVNLRKTAPDENSNDADSVTTNVSEEALAPSITLTEPPQSPRRVPKPEPEAVQKTPTSHVRFSASQDSSRPASGNQTPTPSPKPQRPALSAVQAQPVFRGDKKKAEFADRSSSASRLRFNSEGSTGGILEQAWMMKMAAEVTRRVQEEKATGGGFWHQAEEPEHPPPAYAA